MTVTHTAVRTVAFIGTGLMGLPMAVRLLESGFEVTVWNRTPQKLKALSARGARVAPTPASAAEGVDVICLCLAHGAAIEAVLFGENGIAMGNGKPPLIVDFSTIGPMQTADFASRMYQHSGSAWVDAPVSGGVPGAMQGTLVIFAGGSGAHIETLQPLFRALAQRVTHAGGVGAGQTMKLCNQLIVSSNFIAIAEAIALARAAGIDAGLLPQALAGGFADSIPLQIFGGRMAAGITTPMLGAIALLLKDAGAIDELAKAHHQNLPLAAATLAVYQHAAARGLTGQDLASLMMLYPRIESEALRST